MTVFRVGDMVLIDPAAHCFGSMGDPDPALFNVTANFRVGIFDPTKPYRITGLSTSGRAHFDWIDAHGKPFGSMTVPVQYLSLA